MTRRGYKIPQRQLSPFLQTCLAVIVVWIGYYALSYIVAGLIDAIGSFWG